MKKAIYRITINNWEKHNPNRKKSYRYAMIKYNFLTNPRIASQSPVTRLLYLSCLLVASESNQSQIEVTHESLVSQSGVKSQSIVSQLTQLQSFQLLSWSFLQTLLDPDLELNRIELNRIEYQAPVVSKKQVTEKTHHKIKVEEREQNLKIWETYSNSFRQRYAVDPVRNAMVNSQVSNLRKRLGTEDACKVVEFYLTHNDAFFLKNTHSLGLCLNQAESLRTQMLRGKPITGSMVKSFEKQNSSNETMDILNAKWDAEEKQKAKGGENV